jgi:aryl-alcohol dehydrogenase-like predicted oxidoreductase
VLTGKYNDGIPRDSRFNVSGYEWMKERYEKPEGLARLEKARKLTALAREIGMSVTHLSLAWCLKNPNVSTVILGASRISQLEENLRAMDQVSKLTPEVIERIEAIVENRPNPPQDYSA